MMNTKPALYMLCGLSGSGKSESAKNLQNKLNELNDSTFIFSSDSLREELYGDINDQTHNNEIFQELHSRIKDCLKKGDNAIYDATNIKSKRRRAFLDELKNIDCYKVCHIIWRPYHECVLLNRGRDRIIPENVIKRQYMNWQTPWYFEGWDKIHIVGTCITNSTYYLDEAEKYRHFNQHNYHHNLTLYEHLTKTAQYIRNRDANNYNLMIAGQLHDIGKPFTKTFETLSNIDGNTDSVYNNAHYYQHHCVGAYDALGLYYGDSNSDDKLLISTYITYHMQPYFWKDNPKNEEKYRELWGEDFYNDILLLYEADKAAH